MYISLVYDFILIHHFLVSVVVIEALLCVKFKSILATNAFISCIHVNCELYWFWIKEKYLKGSFSCDVKIKFYFKYVCQQNILWFFPRISTRDTNEKFKKVKFLFDNVIQHKGQCLMMSWTFLKEMNSPEKLTLTLCKIHFC